MRTLWKGAISFGLVNIPVKMYSATERQSIRFNLLHAKCHSPISYKRWCPVCGVEVPPEEIVRGYQYEKGRYVVFSDEELENIPAAATKTIDIIDFVDWSEIDPIFFAKSYFLAPADTGMKAYVLLRDAMSQAGKIAVAKVMIRDKQSLTALRLYQDYLLMVTMYYPDEIRQTAAIPERLAQVAVHENERKMAASLVNNLAAPFQPDKYHDEYRQGLLTAIHNKIAGQEVAVPEQPADGKVLDLMEALRRSVELAQRERAVAQKAAPRRRKKGRGAS